MSTAVDSWLRTHEAEASTLDAYRGYVERTIRPAFGATPVGSITVRLLKELYAELRRCRKRCRSGKPAVDHRTAEPHECREVRHRRRPGRSSKAEPPHDCASAGCRAIECCRPLGLDQLEPSRVGQEAPTEASAAGSAERC